MAHGIYVNVVTRARFVLVWQKPEHKRKYIALNNNKNNDNNNNVKQ